MAHNQLKKLILLAISLGLVYSCSEESIQPDVTGMASLATELHIKNKNRTKEELTALKNSVETFLSKPNTETLITLQHNWVKTHDALLKVKFLAQTSTSQLMIGQIDSSPIEPGFLDSLSLYPETGIISDITVPITEISIREQHQFTDPSEASLGFHVIEYLVFSRPIEDFMPSDDYRVERRRQLLMTITTSLAKALDVYLDIPLFAGTSDPSLHQMIVSLGQGVSQLYGESLKLMVDSHSPYSKTSRENLRTQVGMLKQMVFQPVNLGSQLVQLDALLARDVTHTVQEVSNLLDSDAGDDEIAVRCSALLEGLDHQLRSFIRLTEFTN